MPKKYFNKNQRNCLRNPFSRTWWKPYGLSIVYY